MDFRRALDTILIRRFLVRMDGRILLLLGIVKFFKGHRRYCSLEFLSYILLLISSHEIIFQYPSVSI